MSVVKDYEKTCWGGVVNHDPICILPLPHDPHRVKAELVETREASHPVYQHRNGDKCIWLDDRGWFVPLDAGGEGYSCVSPEHDAQKNHYVERFLSETGKTIVIGNENRSVLQDWVLELPYQQQCVMMCALRGPDGISKFHPMKKVVRAYRASLIKASSLGRPLTERDEGDSFMDIRPLYDVPLRTNGGFSVREQKWETLVKDYYDHVDELPHHYHLHMLHGAQIMGAHHVDSHLRDVWRRFYVLGVYDMHLGIETAAEMDERLNDFDASPHGKNGHHG